VNLPPVALLVLGFVLGIIWCTLGLWPTS